MFLNDPLGGDFYENAGLPSSNTKVCESNYVWMRTFLKTERKNLVYVKP